MLDRWFKKEKPMFTMLGMGGGNAAIVASSGGNPLEITGASVITYQDSTYGWAVQVATNPITFSRDILAEDEIEILLVGGGAGGRGDGGGFGAGGGGGAGGVVFVPKTKGPTIITTAGTYPITIGAGGNVGGSGNDSTITSVAIPLTAGAGGNGGSGNGGGWYPPSAPPSPLQPAENPGVSGINQYGNDGFKGSFGTVEPPFAGGGGGGAGQGGPLTTHQIPGGNGVDVDPLAPGFISPGFPSPIQNALGGYASPSPHYNYFGGGGGGGRRESGTNYPGGLGGGGRGASTSGGGSQQGVDGRGGGGGGGAEPPNVAASPGGDGCFVLRHTLI